MKNTLSRRILLAGMASTAAARAVHATVDETPIAHGALANNALAKHFEPSPQYALPDVLLMSPTGDQAISDVIKGRTVLMPLWAEWCTPCLSELPDFARLQAKYGNANFAIIPVLTGAQKQVTPQVLTQVFADLHASVFTPFVEKRFGHRLFAMTSRYSGASEIPCNLLIDPNGRVVAREFGAVRSDDQQQAATKAAAGGMDGVLSLAQAGDSLSLWGRQPGDEFAAAMADGFMTKG